MTPSSKEIPDRARARLITSIGGTKRTLHSDRRDMGDEASFNNVYHNSYNKRSALPLPQRVGTERDLSESRRSADPTEVYSLMRADSKHLESVRTKQSVDLLKWEKLLERQN